MREQGLLITSRKLDGVLGLPKTSNSVPAMIRDLKTMSLQYVKDELGGPFRGIGRWMLFGAAGSTFFAFSAFFIVLATIRVLQAETGDHLTGNLSWVPYIAGLGAAILLIVFTIWRMIAQARKRLTTVPVNRVVGAK